MSGFDANIDRFIVHVQSLETGLLPRVAALAHESIQTGSPITGAPGQPVDTGNLRASWQLAFPSADVAEISTKSEYAMPNETGVRHDGRPYVQRSPVGGRHSVALTIAGFQKIVDVATEQVGGR